jgi:hypothetical protein
MFLNTGGELIVSSDEDYCLGTVEMSNDTDTYGIVTDE